MAIITIFATVGVLEDWRCDQYRWANQGMRCLSQHDPEVRKRVTSIFKQKMDHH